MTASNNSVPMKLRLVAAVALIAIAVVGFLALRTRPQNGGASPQTPERPVVQNPTPADVKAPQPAPGSVKPNAPALTAPELAAVLDRSRPFDERVKGLAGGAVTEVKDSRDQEALAGILGDPTEDDTVRHEIANLLFRSGYAQLEPCLAKVLENPAEKERFRSWAVQHLGNLLLDSRFPADRQALAGRLRALLTDPQIKVRREALLALVRHDDPAVLKKLPEMIADTAPGADAMRDLAIRCAYDKKMKESLPAIRAQARSADEPVRIAAMNALSQWGDEESRPAFEAALASGSVRLQRAGKAAIGRLDASAGKK